MHSSRHLSNPPTSGGSFLSTLRIATLLSAQSRTAARTPGRIHKHQSAISKTATANRTSSPHRSCPSVPTDFKGRAATHTHTPPPPASLLEQRFLGLNDLVPLQKIELSSVAQSSSSTQPRASRLNTLSREKKDTQDLDIEGQSVPTTDCHHCSTSGFVAVQIQRYKGTGVQVQVQVHSILA